MTMPNITVGLESQTVRVDGMATFICIANGVPTPNISWFADQKVIPQR